MPSHRNVPPKQDEAASSPGPRTLKKYPNRRLYDTRSSSYIKNLWFHDSRFFYGVTHFF